MNPIKHSDIVQPGNPFSEWTKGWESFQQEVMSSIGSLKAELTKLHAAIAGTPSNTKGGQSALKQQATDAAQMSQRIKELERNLNTATAQLKKMEAAYGKLSEQQKKAAQNEETRSRKTTEAYRQELMHQKLLKREADALEGSVAKLKATYNRLVFEMNNYHVKGSAIYDKLNKKADEYHNKIKQAEAAHGTFSRNVGNYLSVAYNKWVGLTVALSGVIYATRRLINYSGELSDAMAAVRRTTGMTQREVYDLNQTLKRMDTRTAQTSLLDLAHVAGKLGIAKEDIAGFVRGADMIGVALGKDIGNNEEAINQLGRIVQIFKLSDSFGMEKALIKVGSALKDLGNASVAEESNIIDFTKRMGGLAAIVDMPVDKIMALAATMDILGQTMEVSSTAVNQMWIAMGKNVEETSKIAGMSAKEFSDLMKKDFNEAFIALAKGFASNAGGIEETANKFGGLAIDGRRLIGVMTALANNTDVYRQQIDIAKQSLDAGTTAAEQFRIQNETLQATLDKVTKSFKNAVANEGSIKLFIATIRGLTNAFEGLQKATAFLFDNTLAPWLNLFTPNMPDTTKLDAQKKQDAERIRQENITIKAFEMLEDDHRQSMIKIYDAIADSYYKMWQKSTGTAKTHYATQYSYAKEFVDKLKVLNAKKGAKIPGGEETGGDILGGGGSTDNANKEWDAYYQWLLKLDMVTWDQMFEHEKAKLIEQGIWQKAEAEEIEKWITDMKKTYLLKQMKQQQDAFNAMLGALRSSAGTEGMKGGKYQINSKGGKNAGLMQGGLPEQGGLVPDSGIDTGAIMAGLDELYSFYDSSRTLPNPFFDWPDETQEIFDKMAEAMSTFGAAANEIMGALGQSYQVQMENEMALVEARYQKEYDEIQRLVDGKYMSEKVGAQKKTELEKKQREEQLKIEKEYGKKQQKIAYTQAIINIATGVTSALAEGPLGILLALAVIAAGAIQLDTIASQKFAKGGSGEVNKKGTVLRGKRHGQGGIPIPGVGEAEDGEYFAIINRKATSKYRNELPELFEAINEGRMNQLFDKRGAGQVNVNVNDKYGKEMLAEMRKPKQETRIVDTGTKIIYETGNYRLVTHKQ